MQNQYRAPVTSRDGYYMMAANESWIASRRATCDIWPEPSTPRNSVRIRVDANPR